MPRAPGFIGGLRIAHVFWAPNPIGVLNGSQRNAAQVEIQKRALSCVPAIEPFRELSHHSEMESAPQPPPPAYTPRVPPKTQEPPENVLHSCKRTFYLSVFFMGLLVAPWALICLLDMRSIGWGYIAWDNVSGTIGEDTVATAESTYRALTTLNTLAAAITVPVLSIILCHAAVVLVQRRHPNQKMTALEMLSLADAPWSRISLSRTQSSKFGFIAFVVIIIGIVQLILQCVLVVPQEIKVATWLDVEGANYPTGMNYYDQLRYRSLGQDPSPGVLAQVPLDVVQYEVATRLGVESESTQQAYLWADRAAIDADDLVEMRRTPNNAFSDFFTSIHGDRPFFTSAFPINTNTGVLRYLSFRLNSSVTCIPISAADFPSTCSGDRPLAGETSVQYNGSEAFQVSWCVPGDYTTSPWAPIRSRQDIDEEVFIRMQVPDDNNYLKKIYALTKSFTTHCTSRSTRGTFELPNYHNQNEPGPLLEKWPDAQEIYAHYNDRGSTSNRAPPDFDDDHTYGYVDYDTANPYTPDAVNTPGPLTTLMYSLLGNASWVRPLENDTLTSDEGRSAVALLDMCTHGIPFLNWDSSDSTQEFRVASGLCGNLYEYLNLGYAIATRDLVEVAFEWFSAFNDTSHLGRTLGAGLYFANQATLSRATRSGYLYENRDIYFSDGASLTKPSVSLAAKVVISLLVSVEVLAIVALLVFIYRQQTFTNRLDSITVASLGADLFLPGRLLPPRGRNESTLKDLRDRDGLVGIREGYHEDSGSDHMDDIELRNLSDGYTPRHGNAFGLPASSLVLGGAGLVPRRVDVPRPVATSRPQGADP